jgi:signal transduction histidine kinase
MQLVDLLAQVGDDNAHSDMIELAYGLLRQWRQEIPKERRRVMSASLAGRPVAPQLVAFFAEDDPAIAAPVIVGAKISDEDWIALIPGLSPAARALLRHRRDVGQPVFRALSSFGAADLVLATTVAAEPIEQDADPAPHVPEIAELVARIEAFRRDRAHRKRPEPDTAPRPVPSVATFRFETDAEGTIYLCEGVSREEIVGVSIAAAAVANHGVDGHAAGAFRRRAPFRDARLTLSHGGAAGGEWQISAVPFFDNVSGRFMGFRGAARRPRPDERAAPPATGLYGSGLPADSLRQLVHELRTPLNAIIGFAEMIDQQVLGPAAADYRGRAGDILGDARRLLGTVDDLDVAARIDAGTEIDVPLAGASDPVAVLRAFCSDNAGLTDARGVTLDTKVDAAVASTPIDALSLDRMFSRLLSATVGLAERGEHVMATLGADPSFPGSVVLTVRKTRAMMGRDEQALLDPGYSPDGDWPDAPALGLGFALRLVRNLAEAAGGRLAIEADRFVLILPGAADSPVGREGQG